MTAYTRLEDVPSDRYDVVLVDPPWTYTCWDGDRHARSAAQNHYPTMTTRDICDLPMADIAAPDCVLLMWATWPTIRDAFSVMDAWGFTYKTCAFMWAKAAGNFVGMGYYTRANSEPCLLATRGHGVRVADRGVRQVLTSAPRAHSQKPRALYERIDRLFGQDARRIEMFCRGTPAAGWDGWGAECDGGQGVLG